MTQRSRYFSDEMNPKDSLLYDIITLCEEEIAMNCPIYYSSVTGNTKKLANYIRKSLKRQGHTVSFVNSTRCKQEIELSEVLILAFWCRRSSMDDSSLRILAQCKGRKILAIGTMGGNVDGDYGRRVEENVRNVINQENECVGVCLCKGAIDLHRMKRRMLLPEDHPRHVNEAKYQKSLLTQGHPNEADLDKVDSFVKKCVIGIMNGSC